MSLDCNIYFLFEEQAFDGLLKVIGNRKQLSLIDILLLSARNPILHDLCDP